MMLLSSAKQNDVSITPDTFYYNRTSSGMECGKINIDYYHIEILHGTHIEIYRFKTREYNEDEQIYSFLTESGIVIVFDPTMHMIHINGETYFINSTIKTNW